MDKVTPSVWLGIYCAFMLGHGRSLRTFNSIEIKLNTSNPHFAVVPVHQQFNSSSAVVVRTSVLSRQPRTPPSYHGDPSLQRSESVHLTALFQGEYNQWNMDLHDEYKRREKTLCTNALISGPRVENISLGLFSTFSEQISVYLETRETRLTLGLDEEEDVELDINSARVFKFLPDIELYNYGREEDQTYLVSVKSLLEHNNNCLYVAVNPPGCPWYDTTSLVRNSKLWTRMLRIGYLPVRASSFPRGFIVSIFPVRNSSECTTLPSPYNTSEVNFLKVKVEKTMNTYWVPIGITVGMVTVITIILLILVVAIWRANMKNHPTVEPAQPENIPDGEEMLEMGTMASSHNGTEEDAAMGRSSKLTREMSPWTPENAYRKHLVKDILNEHLKRGDNKCDHVIHAVDRLTRKKVFLSDMTKMSTNPWHRRQRSKTYLLLVPLLSLFYLIPSAQMVYTELIRSRDTGSLEECYLNYGCSRPYGVLTDFNHIISNIGYWIYGSAFVLLVYIKSKLLPTGHKTHEDHESTAGPLQQHSIFYTMGICMVLQGCFSAIFHLCPSNISLQFDTTIMYIMMILVFVKIFQLRHPDTAYNAFHTMYVFVLVLMIEALSLYIFNYTLRLLLHLTFILGYLTLMIHMAVDIYYYGAIKTNIRKLVPVFVKHAFKYKWDVLYKRKFVLSAGFIFINSCILVYIMVRTFKQPGKDLSTPLLMIGGVNVGLYLLYYFIKKLQEVCNEKFSENPTVPKRFMRLLSFMFFLAALVVGVMAGFLYSSKHQSRNSSPPESRNKNTVCQYFNFFDNHDMWHFTSATALFLAFIGLLIIDDDLLFVPRDIIPVY